MRPCIHLSAFLLALATALPAAPPEAVARLRADAAELSAPAMEGRGNGQRGLDRAAQWALERFRSLGLKAEIQAVPYGIPHRERLAASVTEGGKARPLAIGRELDLYDGRAELDLAPRPLLYIGYGLSIPEHDDLKGLDLRGRTVVVEPWRASKELIALAVRTKLGMREVLEDLAKRGAALVLFTHPEPGRAPLGRFAFDAPCPVGILYRGALSGEAEKALEAAGKGLAVGRPASQELPASLELAVKQGLEPHPLPNVTATVPGTDPALRTEHIVVGAHLDHLGLRGGRVFPGADDNASGCAGLLEIARQSARNPGRRSITFILFGGEEEGFLGSAHWMKAPTVPLPQVKGMVNLDCIGRFDPKKDELGLTGLGLAPEALVRLRGLAPAGLRVATDRGTTPFAFMSDHASFAKARIPSLFFFTGVHSDLHHVSDTAEKLNLEAMADIAEYAFRIVRDQADGEPLRFEPRPALGFQPESPSDLRVRATIGGAAAELGLHPGDRLLALDGQPVSSLQDVNRALYGRKVGESVECQWERGGAKQRGRARLGEAQGIF